MSYDERNKHNQVHTYSTSRSNPFAYLWKNSKRHLIIGIIAIVFLFFEVVLMIIGALLLIAVLPAIITLYLTSAKLHLFISNKNKHEIEELIHSYFDSKQRMSTRKWREVEGPGEINYELEVIDFRINNANSGGLTTVISINFDQTDKGNTAAEIWISCWHSINIGLTPRGTIKANSAINGLIKYLKSN